MTTSDCNKSKGVLYNVRGNLGKLINVKEIEDDYLVAIEEIIQKS